ncbi:hypothetical protein AALA24_07640 [Anaerovoracaceae bacterium 42-11]
MKKMMRIIMVSLLVFLVTSNCFAATRVEETVSPQYEVVSGCATTMDISGGGMVTMEGTLTPKRGMAIDKVEVTLILRDSNGSLKYNQKHTAVWSSVFACYETSKKYQLSKRGTYTLQARYDVYKKGSLVETIYANQITKSY